jgi:8-oxo-dGTP pyrophosphatase MutT (NUDIX family)
MDSTNFAYYEATIKILLKKDDKILALTTSGGLLDFPGGRIDETEVDLALTEVLKREVAEELGEDVEFKVGNLAFVSKRQYTKDMKIFRALAIFYEAKYISGKIALSDEHTISEWIKPAELLSRDNKYMTPDEEAQLRAYFK